MDEQTLKRAIRVTSNSVQQVAKTYGGSLKKIHIAVTAALVCWGCFLSWKVTHAQTDNRRQAWQFVGQTWMGTNQNGIFWNVLTLWTFTIVLTAVYPVVMQFISKMRVAV